MDPAEPLRPAWIYFSLLVLNRRYNNEFLLQATCKCKSFALGRTQIDVQELSVCSPGIQVHSSDGPDKWHTVGPCVKPIEDCEDCDDG